MLELFIMETCPYCHKVMDFLRENKIEYLKRDVAEPANREKLMRLGGQAQVPFAYDKDNALAMYESDHIIDYLKEKYEHRA
jgi:glutathione S-transferase